MSSFPEINLFDKGPPYRCLLDVEATGASAVENLCGANGYTAGNVSFNVAQQAIEFGTVPSAIWFDQTIPIQRTDNFYIRARVKLNSMTGQNAPIISCQEGYPKSRGWNLRAYDRMFFSLLADKTNNILKISCDLPSINVEHLIEVIGTYSGGVLNVEILYDSVVQPVTIESDTLTAWISYSNACTLTGRFNQWTGWTEEERGCMDTVRDIRVEVNGVEVFNVPGNEFYPGKIYNRITGEEPIQLRPVSRDRCGGLDIWFGSTFLRFTLPPDFDTRDFSFACWCEYSFNEENQDLFLFRIIDAVEGASVGYLNLHFYHYTGFFKLVVRDSISEDAPYVYDTILRTSPNKPVFIACSRSASGKYIQWVNDRASKISWQSRPIAPIANVGTMDLFLLDTNGRRKLYHAWMWDWAFTESDFLNLYKLTKGYVGAQ